MFGKHKRRVDELEAQVQEVLTLRDDLFEAIERQDNEVARLDRARGITHKESMQAVNQVRNQLEFLRQITGARDAALHLLQSLMAPVHTLCYTEGREQKDVLDARTTARQLLQESRRVLNANGRIIRSANSPNTVQRFEGDNGS